MNEIVKVWQEYINQMGDWQDIIKGVEPKATNCGPVYELGSPLQNHSETMAVSDMRGVQVAFPHYHKGETEIYFVVQGSGLTVVGGKEFQTQNGSVVVIPPDTTHFTIPEKDLVMIVVNSPRFEAENVVDVTESDPETKFDKSQYEGLLKR